MASKKQPRKPRQPLGHIVFSKKGPVRKVIETLPEYKDQLEEAVVKKFAGALSHFEGRQIQDITKSDPWPDFEGTEKGSNVGIEIGELVNQRHNILRSAQQSYEVAIIDELGDRIKMFDGLDITLADNCQTPRYPKVGSVKGRAIIESFVSNLLASVSELEAYTVQQVFRRRWQDDAESPKTGIYGHRFADKKAGLPARIRFFGCFPEYEDRVVWFLAEAVAGKIAKSYTPYAKGSLILLIYEVGSISVEPGESQAILIARELLGTKEHNFDEAWYIFPYADHDMGAINKIWLKPDSFKKSIEFS